MDISLHQAWVRGLLERPEDHPWTMQDIGLLGLRLDDRREYRLHVWDPSSCVGEPPIHDHPFDFTSTIIAGEMTNIRFDEDPSGVEHRRERYSPSDEGARRADTVRLSRTTTTFAAGDQYSQSAHQLHESRQLSGHGDDHPSDVQHRARADGVSTRRSAMGLGPLASCCSGGGTADHRHRAGSALRRRSGLRDADEIARGVTERAVARAPGLGHRLLQHLGARRPDLLERGVQVVGTEDRRLQRPLRHQRQQGVALGLRPATVRLGQDDVDVLPRGADGDPAEAVGRDVVADLEAERVAIEDERGIGIVDGDEHGGNGECHATTIRARSATCFSDPARSPRSDHLGGPPWSRRDHAHARRDDLEAAVITRTVLGGRLADDLGEA